ncbi:hypothetical protein Ancab_011082 [Ancistrocladus abbreviatus]
MATYILLSLFCTIVLPIDSPTQSQASLHPPLLRDGGGGAAARQLWCVAKNNAEDSALQAAIDWACGPGGADCGPIQQGGLCYDPNDMIGLASYAFNDYCLKNGISDDSCNFDNTAALTSLDPSHDKCKFPSSSSGNITSSGPSTASLGMDMSGADMSTNSQFGIREVYTLGLLFFAATMNFL